MLWSKGDDDIDRKSEVLEVLVVAPGKLRKTLAQKNVLFCPLVDKVRACLGVS